VVAKERPDDWYKMSAAELADWQAAKASPPEPGAEGLRPVPAPAEATGVRFLDRTWALDICRLAKTRMSATTRHVALVFMLHVDFRTLEAYPGQEVLAAECGLSRRTVWQALQRLKRSGWLVRVSKASYSTGEAEVLRLHWPDWHPHADLNR
jgi:Bacterial regulatory proteins, gntR family